MSIVRRTEGSSLNADRSRSSIAERIALMGLRLVDCARCGSSVATDQLAGPVRCDDCNHENG